MNVIAICNCRSQTCVSVGPSMAGSPVWLYVRAVWRPIGHASGRVPQPRASGSLLDPKAQGHGGEVSRTILGSAIWCRFSEIGTPVVIGIDLYCLYVVIPCSPVSGYIRLWESHCMDGPTQWQGLWMKYIMTILLMEVHCSSELC
jgi:hypothetical protein